MVSILQCVSKGSQSRVGFAFRTMLTGSSWQGREHLRGYGSQSLKNIAEPMRAWRVRIGPSSSPATKTPTEIARPLALPDKTLHRRAAVRDFCLKHLWLNSRDDATVTSSWRAETSVRSRIPRACRSHNFATSSAGKLATSRRRDGPVVGSSMMRNWRGIMPKPSISIGRVKFQEARRQAVKQGWIVPQAPDFGGRIWSIVQVCAQTRRAAHVVESGGQVLVHGVDHDFRKRDDAGRTICIPRSNRRTRPPVMYS